VLYVLLQMVIISLNKAFGQSRCFLESLKLLMLIMITFDLFVHGVSKFFPLTGGVSDLFSTPAHRP